ncbi:MAG: membrane protein insertase YidC, partial [bacterium]
MEFDKKTILAFLLIGVIFIIMQTDFYQKRFLPPPEEKPFPEAVDKSQPPADLEPEELQQSVTEPVAVPSKESARVSRYESLLSTPDKEEEINVETSLYTAVFSTRGATVKSFVLKKYSLNKGGFVQLIGGDGVGTLGVLLPTTVDTLDTSGLLFEASKRRVSLSQRKNSDVLEFVVKLDDSRQIKKTYTFFQDRYDIDLKIEFRNLNDLIEGFSY